MTPLVFVALSPLARRRGTIDRERAAALADELAAIPAIPARESAIETLADRFAPNWPLVRLPSVAPTSP